MGRNTKKYVKIGAIAVLFAGSLAVAYPRAFSFAPPVENTLDKLKINLGLDLQGGAHLEYEAQLDQVGSEDTAAAMDAVQATVERRVNAIGVGEPKVYQAQSGDSRRIVVELPGVEDISDAKARIQDAPLLEFKEYDPENENAKKILDQFNGQAKQKAQETLDALLAGEKDFAETAKEVSQDPGSKDKGGELDFVKKGELVPEFDAILFDDSIPFGEIYPQLVESSYGYHIIEKEEKRYVKEDSGEVVGGPGEGIVEEVRARHILFSKMTIDSVPQLAYVDTGLTGQYLDRATVEFPQQQYGLGEPVVSLQFNSEGADMFANITERSVGKPLAIFVDGELISQPTVNEKISGGRAQISGSFTVEQAKDLAKRLNEGALPVPLKLVSEGSRSATLGAEELTKSIRAGAIGLGLVVVYMILYYRLLGVVAAFALLLYTAMIVALFKLSGLGGAQFQITLTLSGIAGFVLSIGMAVDANILIFERTREELRHGKGMLQAIKEGFKRAWTSIRDGNSSTILTALILVWMGTGFVQGFALILMLGVLVSMFTAVTITRTILLLLPMRWLEKYRWLVR